MSLFKRLLNPKGKSEDKVKNSDHSKYYPEETLPIDERFTYNFNRNGGKFLYCENMEEILEAFDNILLENDWYERDVFCLDEMLTSRFDGFNLNFITKANAFVIARTVSQYLLLPSGFCKILSKQAGKSFNAFFL